MPQNGPGDLASPEASPETSPDVPAAPFDARIVPGRPGVVTVAVAGDLDLTTCPRLDRTIREALAARPWHLTIDLTTVTFCGCTGLRTLAVLHTAAERAGTRLAVRSSPAIDRLLRLTGQEDAFPVLDAVPQPRRAGSRGPVPRGDSSRSSCPPAARRS